MWNSFNASIMFLDIRHLCKPKLQINYPLNIQFYFNELSSSNYDNVISLARETIKVLKIITTVTRDNPGKSDEYIRSLVIERLKNIQSCGNATLLDSKRYRTSSDQDIQNRWIDHASFIA
ncbi:uncharacterized protein LOC141524911 [Cotesia typhae]|uniref:uncharacterized protein LOC141524911 n=1 Tax=Cotesia typhae TaxID=2053667 RepID=UPI003D68E690